MEASVAPAKFEMSAARLAAALDGVRRPMVREVSAKVIGGKLRDGRLLVGFPRDALAPQASQKLAAICASLDAPEAAIAELDAFQSRAISVHFGFEPGPSGALAKCYLEFGPKTAPEPGLVFLAVKWRGAEWVTTRYWYRGNLDAAERVALIAGLVPEGPMRHLLVDLNARPELANRLLEVEEPNNPRRSIDLNLSEANLTVEALRGALSSALGGGPSVDAYLGRHKADRISHIAAGTARDGADFATLYHGTSLVHESLLT